MDSPSKPASRRLLDILKFKTDYSKRPWGFQWRSSQWFIVTTVSVALWTDFFLYGLIVPILPFLLEERLKLPDDRIQSYVSGLLAAFAASSFIFSPITGFLADQLPSKQIPFLLGLVALLASTTLLLVGTTLSVLFLARVLQGLSGAFVWTIGLVLCVETVGTENLGKTMGSIFGFISVGNLLAPPLGGILYHKSGYRGIFGISFALIAIDFVMRIFVIENRVADRYNNKNSSPGTISADNHGHGHDNFQAQIASSSAVDGVDEAAPLLGSSNASPNDQDGQSSCRISPNLPAICRKVNILPCLTDIRLLTSMFLCFVQAVLLGSLDATIPTVAQEYYNLSPLAAGMLFVPLGLANLFLGPFFGWCVDKFGTKRVAVLGYLYLALCLCLLRLAKPGGFDQAWFYGSLLALCGIGLASISSPPLVESAIIVEAYYDANKAFFGYKKPYAQLYGLNNMIFSAGLTIGPELAGELKQVIGYGNMSTVLAGICVISALLAWKNIGNTSKRVG